MATVSFYGEVYVFVFHNREFPRTFKFLFYLKNRIQIHLSFLGIALKRLNHLIYDASENSFLFLGTKNCRAINFLFSPFLLVLLLLCWRYTLIHSMVIFYVVFCISCMENVVLQFVQFMNAYRYPFICDWMHHTSIYPKS